MHRLEAMAKVRLGPLVARRQRRRVDLPHSLWGLRIGPNGTLWSDGVDLAELARTEGTPLHVVRTMTLDRNIDLALGPASGDRDAAPARTDFFYSYKTNPVPAVLRRLHERGIGAEVISPYELWLAMQLGVPAERIIYNGPAKSVESMRTAIEAGILLVNANSESELARIAGTARDLGRTVNMGIRFSLPGMWGGQFGIASDSPAAVRAVRDALDHPNVTLRGLHVHRGLTLGDHDTFVTHVTGVLDLCDRLRAETGWHPQILDIGGSLACPTVRYLGAREHRMNRALGTDLLPPDPASVLGLVEAATLAAELVGDHFRSAGQPVPRIVQEPGRALTGNTQFLLTSVVDVKTDTNLHHAVLDAGINVAEPVPNEYHQLFSATAPAAAPERPYRLVGPICTPADVLYNNWQLPALEPGHVLAIMDSGAYFVPFSTAFSFPRPKILVQAGDTITTARRAETFEDLVALDRSPTGLGGAP